MQRSIRRKERCISLASQGVIGQAEESNTAMGGLADGERSTSAEDGSAMIPKAAAGTIRPLGAEARAAGDAPESGSMERIAPEELTVPTEASQGMVGPAVWPHSPPVVPSATAEEEDMVEEIVHAEPRTQSI